MLSQSSASGCAQPADVGERHQVFNLFLVVAAHRNGARPHGVDGGYLARPLGRPPRLGLRTAVVAGLRDKHDVQAISTSFQESFQKFCGIVKMTPYQGEG